LKYGTPEQKEQIVKILLSSDLTELAKSKYGHFLIIKLLAHLNKKQLEQAFEVLLKNIDLILHIPVELNHNFVLKFS